MSISPKQANATCPGQIITLICKNGTADGMVWQINGKEVAVYFPGPQENPCQDTKSFPNGDVGRYCGWTSNDETSSNLTFTTKPEQDKWNVTCLGSDSTFNDTTMLMVAKRKQCVCGVRVKFWCTYHLGQDKRATFTLGGEPLPPCCLINYHASGVSHDTFKCIYTQ